jgi:hypothetical protein
MQTLDIDRPGMPDLQFTLLVTALCTSPLTALNIPDRLRTTIFDRCWVLIHDTPPPERREERVLDLRPWTEVTLDAMVETIRTVLSDADIRILTWDHTPSDPTWISTPEARPLIERLDVLYPQPALTPASEGVSDGVPTSSDLRQVIGELEVLMSAFSPALKRCAADLSASGDDRELAAKLLKGAAFMQESGYVYLAWARHYAARAEGLEDADEGDESAIRL